jgi:hypothetical protein
MTTPLEQRPNVGSERHRRTAFGLALSIDPRISIPELGCSPGSTVAEPPSRIGLDPAELRRRWEALGATPKRVREIRFGEALQRSIDFAEPAGYLLWARDFGRVLISPDGAELLCEPDPANENWARIVSAQALPLAATLRGLEVMHASGVVLDGRAVIITGPPGAGKSSLAAALVRVGGRLLSDDAVALALDDGTLIAHAGSLALQLRVTEHERLCAEERAALGRPAGVIEGKRRYLSADSPQAAPLEGVFLLERSAAEPAVEPLGAVDPFELIASTFNLSVRTPERLRRQLDVVSAIAANGLAHRLRVQPGVDAGHLAEIVREHLRRRAVPGVEPAPSGAAPRRERLLEL